MLRASCLITYRESQSKERRENLLAVLGWLAGVAGIETIVVEQDAAPTLGADLAPAGARVVEWTPPAVPQAVELYFSLLACGGEACLRVIGDDPRDPRLAQLLYLAGRSNRLCRALAALVALSGQRTLAAGVRTFGRRSAGEYWMLVEELIDYREHFARRMVEAGALDILIAPACGLPALRHGQAKDLVLVGGYTLLYNALGYPAGVVPWTTVRPGEESERPTSSDLVERAAARCERDSSGLPIGVQVVAPPWREEVVLAVMHAIEAAAPAPGERAADPR